MECITIKIKLKDICDDNTFDIITKTVNDINRIIDISYPLMRSFILAVIENKVIENKVLSVPLIDQKFVSAFLGISAFGTTKIKNLTLKNDLKHYYKYFCNKTHINTQPLKAVTYILQETTTEIYNAIINNIKYHFDKYIWKFIRYYFNDDYEDAKTKGQLKSFLKNLNQIKDFLLTDNSNIKLSDEHYKWVCKYKKYLLPITYTYNHFETDITENTYNYLKCMHYVCKYLQKHQFKSLQFFPLKTSVCKSHITINTNSLIKIFKEPDTILNETIKQNLWLKYFQLTDNEGSLKYKRKYYSFKLVFL